MVMLTVMGSVNFIFANVPNHQFVALLEETDSENDELIHRTNTIPGGYGWLCQWVCFGTVMRFVECHQIVLGKRW
jgi:hypothetical protein